MESNTSWLIREHKAVYRFCVTVQVASLPAALFSMAEAYVGLFNNAAAIPVLDILNTGSLVAAFVLSSFLADKLRRYRHLLPVKAAPDAKTAKRNAKRINERLKLGASFLNSVGGSVFLVSVLTPILIQHSHQPPLIAGALIAACCHAMAQGLLYGWRSEE